MTEDRMKPNGPVDVQVDYGDDERPSGRESRMHIPDSLPILPVKDMSMFPRMVLPMLISDQKHARLIDDVLTAQKMVGLVAIKGETPSAQVESMDQIHHVGVVALILRMNKEEDQNAMRLVAQGLSRFRVVELTRTEPYLVGSVEPVQDLVTNDMETMALFSNLRGLFKRMLDLAPHMPEELSTLAVGIDDPGALCDLAASTIKLGPDDRQSVVEAIDVRERLRRVTTLLNHEIQVLELGSKIQSQVKEGLDKTQRDYYLRQQLKAIKQELGEGEEGGASEVDDLRARLAEAHLPEEADKEAQRELKRLAKMHSSSSEYHVISTYLDWMINLPWNQTTADQIDIDAAHKILEDDHFGLDKVKQRILEFLAVRKLNPEVQGSILCFVGPPGVGKTSLGRSIARSMGRKFSRISLGGVRDEAEIRGHRRTYVGAMPGRIIQSIRRVGSKNPVLMLDEIDKLGADFRGDPSSALLEVLDPEQNRNFSDHYLDVAFDLSKVMFVTTANVLDTIPAPLRDRMEIIEIPGYTAEEKLKIAKRYLVPRQRKLHGLGATNLAITDGAVNALIQGYTREAGLRNLEREIGAVCRWAARKVAEGETAKIVVGRADLQEIRGPARFSPEAAMRTAMPGVATGMAWTPTGGDILFVEATDMPGQGRLTLTGQLGDVMKESAQAAVSYVRANAERLGVDPEFHKTRDLHIHVPAGAIPKDGPSAGVTLYTALLSLLTDRQVRPDVSMTGEITLRGMVLPVGGIKEKVLAAKRAGIKEIILPAQNKRDLTDVPEAARQGLVFHFAERMDQVPRWALATKSSAKAKHK